MCIVEEYGANGDLLQLIKARKRIDEIEGRILFRQLIEGLRVSFIEPRARARASETLKTVCVAVFMARKHRSSRSEMREFVSRCKHEFKNRFANTSLDVCGLQNAIAFQISGDFGFARYLRDGENSHTYCGSKAYVALEIMQSIKYNDNAVDIWSAGEQRERKLLNIFFCLFALI